MVQRVEWRSHHRRKSVCTCKGFDQRPTSSTATFLDNSTLYIDQIVGPLNDARIPFSSTHGVCLHLVLHNSLLTFSAKKHDNEPNITHLAEIRREQLIAPLSYTRVAPPGVGGPEGPGTYWVPVR